MIGELGHYALVLATFVAIIQSVVPLIGAHRGDRSMMALGSMSASGQFVCLSVAFAALTYAFVASDFSIATVAANSHSAKPMLYKVSGVWGNHEGSLLLWVLILALFGVAVVIFGANLPPTLKARVLAVQAMITVGFLLFMLGTSNPFERLDPVPLDGRDLNPLLQDPGLAFHPPMLYLGYVGFSMAFSFAVAALIEGRVDPAWARWVRPWTLLAWTFLTAGIALGSWWAYYELGWGGWWFWDPVENASFMPWLAGTALLHSAIVVEKRDALKSWTILLAIVAFSFSLIGTFLVRSGVLTSVHAFAVDPERGLFILALLVVAIGGSLTLYAIRAPQMKATGVFAPVSREGGLVLNNLLLSAALATVFIGTLYPLFLDAMTGQTVSVGPPFFNATFVPLMMPLVAVLAIGPMLAWKRADISGVFAKLIVAAGVTLVATGLVWWWAGGPLPAVLGMAFAIWLAAGVATEWAERIRLFRIPLGDSLRRAAGLPRAAYGMTLAHLGLAVFIVGAVADSFWTREIVIEADRGQVVEVAGYTVTFEGVRRTQGPNYVADTATLRVEADGAFLGTLSPERRFYPVQQTPTTEAAIRSTALGDLYVAIGDPIDGTRWILRVWFNPLVPWIWAGSILMVIGGIVSLTDRRLRVGAPRQQARPSGPTPTGAVAAGAD